MAGNTKEERDKCIGHYPDLEYDLAFVVNSDEDKKYNCIAFAIGYQDIWIATGRDIAWFWWPNHIPLDTDPNSLVETFRYFGFEVCNDDLPEAGYDKVALYQKDGNWTHAARIIADGVYHSKLGESFDIFHRRGDVMDKANNPSESYGIPFVFMKRKYADRSKLVSQKPQPGNMRYKGHDIPFLLPDQCLPGFLASLGVF